MKEIFHRDKSIVPACDVPLEVFEEILQKTGDLEKVGGYKVGFSLMLEQGLPEIEIPKNTLYNHRAGACDIPDMGKKFMHSLSKHDNIDGVILTPMTGPETFERWVEAADDNGLQIYVEPLLKTTYTESQGGYMDDKAIDRIIQLGSDWMVDGFIFPAQSDMKRFVEMIDMEHTDVILRDNGRIHTHVYELMSYDVMEAGLSKVMDVARRYTDKPIIYDHQKAGTDVPENASRFAEAASDAGIDAVIFFPLAGPKAQSSFIREADQKGLGVLVGGYMTHPKFVESQRGYIVDEATEDIYLNAAEEGVNNYIVPGNKPDVIKRIRKSLEAQGVEPRFSAPGFVAQGDCSITDSGKAAGKYMHAIVGRGIYGADDKRQATIDLGRDL